MPVGLQINFPSGTVKQIVWVDEKNNTFDFRLPERPIEVFFDPDNWIFCEVEDHQKKAKGKR